MTLTEYIAHLDRVIQQIERDGERQAAIAGQDLAALITNRVIQKGETATGGKFTPYSNTPVPAFFYFNKSRRGSAETAVRAKAKRKEKISYREFRGLNGLNTGFKNFEFTGEMWRNFRVVGVSGSGGKYVVTLGGSIPIAQDKIDWMSAQEKRSIIEPSDTEIKIITNNLTAWAVKLING